MRVLKNSLLIFIVNLFVSCAYKENVSINNFPPPPPPPNIKPDLPAPTYIPSFPKDFVVQINPIPHPLSIDGQIPFVVWVNGKRLELSGAQVKHLTQSLNIKYEKPQDTAEIHDGEGWLEPLKEVER